MRNLYDANGGIFRRIASLGTPRKRRWCGADGFQSGGHQGRFGETTHHPDDTIPKSGCSFRSIYSRQYLVSMEMSGLGVNVCPHRLGGKLSPFHHGNGRLWVRRALVAPLFRLAGFIQADDERTVGESTRGQRRRLGQRHLYQLLGSLCGAPSRTGNGVWRETPNGGGRTQETLVSV